MRAHQIDATPKGNRIKTDDLPHPLLSARDPSEPLLMPIHRPAHSEFNIQAQFKRIIS